MTRRIWSEITSGTPNGLKVNPDPTPNRLGNGYCPESGTTGEDLGFCPVVVNEEVVYLREFLESRRHPSSPVTSPRLSRKSTMLRIGKPYVRVHT